MIGPKLIQLPTLSDHRGGLAFIEGNTHIPFDIKRVYYLYDVPPNRERGAHGHKELEQILISLNGSFEVHLDNGSDKKFFLLSNPGIGLYVPKMMWRDLKYFTPGSVCLVLASQVYSEDDYYRNYQDFLNDCRK